MRRFSHAATKQNLRLNTIARRAPMMSFARKEFRFSFFSSTISVKIRDDHVKTSSGSNSALLKQQHCLVIAATMSDGSGYLPRSIGSGAQRP
jgi:hypothetical protein